MPTLSFQSRRLLLRRGSAPSRLPQSPPQPPPRRCSGVQQEGVSPLQGETLCLLSHERDPLRRRQGRAHTRGQYWRRVTPPLPLTPSSSAHPLPRHLLAPKGAIGAARVALPPPFRPSPTPDAIVAAAITRHPHSQTVAAAQAARGEGGGEGGRRGVATLWITRGGGGRRPCQACRPSVDPACKISSRQRWVPDCRAGQSAPRRCGGGSRVA